MNARMLCRLAQALSCVLACIGCAGSTARPSAYEVSRGGSELVASATGATCAFDETAVLEAGERLALRGLQPGDARRRGEALASAKSALETGSPAQATAALHAWARWNELPFDRAEARALVEQHLAAPEAPRRRAAWRALSALGRMEGLCESSMALIDDPDPSLRADALRFVGAACGGLVGARTEQLALSTLDEARARGGWSRACRSIRGLRLGPGLQQRLLDAALDGDEDAAAVTQSLSGAGIDYRMENGTGGISVPAETLNEARLLLAGQGVMQSGGFANLTKDGGLGVSQFMEGARYQHALEIALARTISSLQQVAAARVHIAAPRSSSFVRDRSPGSASVFLQLKPGRRLASEQVTAVVNLVASSLPDIDASQVTVVDQQGRLLSPFRQHGQAMGQVVGHGGQRQVVALRQRARVSLAITPTVVVVPVRRRLRSLTTIGKVITRNIRRYQFVIKIVLLR